MLLTRRPSAVTWPLTIDTFLGRQPGTNRLLKLILRRFGRVGRARLQGVGKDREQCRKNKAPQGMLTLKLARAVPLFTAPGAVAITWMAALLVNTNGPV
jgi:hypothetical protein